MSDYEHDPDYHQGRSAEQVREMYKAGGQAFMMLIAAILAGSIWYCAESLYRAFGF